MAEIRLVERRKLLDADGVEAKVFELAEQIAAHASKNPVGLVGIQTGGVHLARRILERLEAMGLEKPHQGVLDITLYRDDIFLGLQQPLVRRTDIPFEVSGTDVILVDDVLYTGRTVRAALDALVDFGRPRAIKLAVLVDRGLREYPIQADWKGMTVDTIASETVQVELTEMDAATDRVVVYERDD
ncbi:MAG: bifunctional pyr operon transcriptional regulator/uracil phosphoribosyltransferase PyrR [Deltaproteobacteria bacterium]|nr:bifunctional pyr operon transcriptional regulator/uracil phosphoribosyltransferase PyrR [Deltaproteobacteria bacterium]